jgi:hypothetical protein
MLIIFLIDSNTLLDIFLIWLYLTQFFYKVSEEIELF